MSRTHVAFIAALFALTSSVSAQGFDPESGDTGQGWQPPPPQQQNPPPQQQQQQPPPQQQQQQQPPQQQQQQQWGQQQQGGQQQGSWGQQQGGQQQGGSWGQGGQQQQGGWGSDNERPPAMGGAQEHGSDTTPEGETDHDQVGFGITYFGFDRLRLTPDAGIDGAISIPTATVGIRYWLGTIGLDIGLALGVVTNETTNLCIDAGCTDSARVTGLLDSAFAFGLHLGLPIAINKERHHTLLFIPELGFAYGTGTIFGDTTDATLDIDLTALQIDVGLRFGGEVHFGGIGLPNLALQLTIGLGLRYATQSAANSVPLGGGGIIDFESSGIQLRTIANDYLDGLLRINYYF